ncbi:MAG: hypothetical protein PUD20_07320 [bacterium]|nr:hypothetical protein [bacterium]
MIHNERVRRMVKLQSFEDRKGREYDPVLGYYRNDYVGLHLIKGFVYGTISFGIMLAAWGIGNMAELLANLHTMDIRQFVIDMLLRYLAFIAVYLLGVYAYAHTNYSKAKKEIKRHNRNLKKVIGSFNQDGGES